MVAAGAAAHSDHGRDLAETLLAIGEGKTKDYAIRDEAKLRRVAKECGIDEAGKDTLAVARDLANRLLDDFGCRGESVAFAARAPQKRRELWEKLGVMRDASSKARSCLANFKRTCSTLAPSPTFDRA